MKEIVIFDIDNTLIKGQSQQIFLKYLYQKKLIGLIPFLRIYFWFIFYKLGLIKNPKKIMDYAFSFLRGWKTNDFEKIINEFFQKELINYFFQEGIEIIKDHREKGREIILVSNAFFQLTAMIAKFLSVNNYIGTELKIADGKFTGEVTEKIVYGKNKVAWVKKIIDKNGLSLNNSYAYADHISDIPILELASFPFAINPTPSLAKKAREKNWPIMIFKTLNK